MGARTNVELVCRPSALLPPAKRARRRAREMALSTHDLEGEEQDSVALVSLHPNGYSDSRLRQGIDTEQYIDSARPSLSHTTDGDDDVDAALLHGDEDERTAFKSRRGTLSGVSFDFSRNLLALPLSQELEANQDEEKTLGVISGQYMHIQGLLESLKSHPKVLRWWSGFKLSVFVLACRASSTFNHRKWAGLWNLFVPGNRDGECRLGRRLVACLVPLWSVGMDRGQQLC
jgi:hypothetical protein